MLNAEGELPLGAALAPTVEQRVPVHAAVRLHIRRDALLLPSTLGRRQPDLGDAIGREAERVAAIAHWILKSVGDATTLAIVRGGEVHQVTLGNPVSVCVVPQHLDLVDGARRRVRVGIDAGNSGRPSTCPCST